MFFLQIHRLNPISWNLPRQQQCVSWVVDRTLPAFDSVRIRTNGIMADAVEPGFKVQFASFETPSGGKPCHKLSYRLLVTHPVGVTILVSFAMTPDRELVWVENKVCKWRFASKPVLLLLFAFPPRVRAWGNRLGWW